MPLYAVAQCQKCRLELCVPRSEDLLVAHIAILAPKKLSKLLYGFTLLFFSSMSIFLYIVFILSVRLELIDTVSNKVVNRKLKIRGCQFGMEGKIFVHSFYIFCIEKKNIFQGSFIKYLDRGERIVPQMSIFVYVGGIGYSTKI